MTRRIVVVAVSAFALIVGAVPALAGGQLKTTLALAGQSGAAKTSVSTVSGSATFDVTRSYAYTKDTIWVYNKCWDASGAEVVNQGSAVVWGTDDSLTGQAGPMYVAGTHCTAWVSVAGKQLGSAINYNVS